LKLTDPCSTHTPVAALAPVAAEAAAAAAAAGVAAGPDEDEEGYDDDAAINDDDDNDDDDDDDDDGGGGGTFAGGEEDGIGDKEGAVSSLEPFTVIVSQTLHISHTTTSAPPFSDSPFSRELTNVHCWQAHSG
jgi:hypothetical protein